MDISKISTESTHFDEAVECVLYDETGAPETDSKGQPVAVYVLSNHSAPAKRIGQQHRTRIMKLTRRYGGFDKIPSTELDQMDVERIAACIARWAGFEANGEPFALTFDNAVVVLKALQARRPHQFAQIESAIQQHADFFTTRSAT